MAEYRSAKKIASPRGEKPATPAAPAATTPNRKHLKRYTITKKLAL
jgi:hypothetical protein